VKYQNTKVRIKVFALPTCEAQWDTACRAGNDSFTVSESNLDQEITVT